MSRRILILFFLLLCLSVVSAEVSIQERQELQKQVDIIINLLNSNDFDALSKYVDLTLLRSIESGLAEKNVRYYGVKIGDYSQIEEGIIKLTGSYNIDTPDWDSSGSLIYFTFKNKDDVWLLVDTNYHNLISPKYFLKFILSISLIFLLMILIMAAFWIWMMIDCGKREFEGDSEKLLWFLIIFLSGIIGAIIYYIVVKRMNKSIT
jgi:hypothetical protein